MGIDILVRKSAQRIRIDVLCVEPGTKNLRIVFGCLLIGLALRVMGIGDDFVEDKQDD